MNSYSNPIEIQPRRRLGIFEDNIDGHRLSYVRSLLNAHSEFDDMVAILPEPALTSPLLGPVSPPVYVHTLTGRRSRSLSQLAKLCDALALDRLVVPDGDSIALRLGMGFPWRSNSDLALLVMREPRPTSARFGSRQWFKAQMKQQLLLRASRKARVEISILRSPGDIGVTPHAIVFDPASWAPAPSIRAEMTDGLGIDEGIYLFGVVGALTKRKNIALVAQALATITGQGLQAGLILAGPQAADATEDIATAHAIAHKSGFAFYEVSRRLSDVELDSIMDRIDCVVIAHSNEGPSGILMKCALGGKKVIVAGAQSLRSDAAMVYEAGAEWVPLDRAALANALARAASVDADPVMTARAKELLSPTSLAPLLARPSARIRGRRG